MNIPEQIDTIYNRGNSIIYQFKAADDGRKYVLKVLPEDFPGPKQITQFNMEYELTHDLNIPGVRRAFRQLKHKNHQALVLEYFEGQTLRNESGKKWPLNEFLPLAIFLADTIGQIHLQNIIHKDINSNNILFNADTGKASIIDFGLATRQPKDNQQLYSPGKLDGTLHYISPEQTGRMNRSVDYRTDLYSLGIVFYELLTGKRPFESNDAMELVHFHIALNPDLREVPAPLDQILGKLLAKNAEDRYQSAFGLKYDLEQCARQWRETGKLAAFQPAQKDYSQFFNIPQKLYGREKQIERLIEEFEKAREHASRLLLIAGYSGIGKSALVNEVQKPVTARKGYFISGKFDQFQRNIPYFAFIRAFEVLTEQLLTESPEQLAAWKDKIENALGVNGQVIIEVIPAVELIIGPQPPLQPLGPAESQNRFNLAFQNFIKVFAEEDHPLAIFIDDLQWADSASLRLMENLLLDQDIRNLLLIGAYRDNEVGDTHPLMLSLKELNKKVDRIFSITLTPLKPEEVNQLVADTLNRTMPDCRELSRLIFDKTNGNPFFVTQFFKKLYDDDLVRFSFEDHGWTWDVEEIRRMNITDNVVDLMSQKIQTFSDETARLLQLAACIGDTFDLQTLSAISQQPIFEVCGILQESMSEGLTPALDENYKYYLQKDLSEREDLGKAEFRFLHDRIQQAAYSLIPESERRRLHLEIGRLLLRDLSEEEREDRLFDIANHLNFGLELVSAPEERTKYVQLNMEAGQKAKTSTAYASSLNYLYNGIQLLKPNFWTSEEEYPLAFQLHMAAAECEYLNNNQNKAWELLDLLLEKSQNTMEKVQVRILRGNIAQTVGDSKLGLQEFSDGLALLGIHVPKEVTQEMIGAGIQRIETLRAGRPIADLANLPIMEDPEKYSTILLILHGATPAFFVNKNLWAWFVLEGIATLLEHGIVNIGDVLFPPYGLFIGQALGNFEAGYEWGKLGIAINKKFNNRPFIPKINVVFGNMVSHWRTHLKHNVDYAREAFEVGVENGDLIYAGISVFHMPFCYFLLGKPLEEVQEMIQTYYDFLEKTQDFHIEANRILDQMILALQGKTNAPYSLNDAHYDEDTKKEELTPSFNQIPIHIFYYAKLRLHYHCGRYKEAVASGAKALELVEASLGMQIVPDQYFFHSLSLAAYYPEAPGEEQESLLALLDTLIEQMGKWADNAPMNYKHKHLLLKAERARAIGTDEDLSGQYDEAIEWAEKNEYHQDAALINELAGRFWLLREKPKFAKVYLSEALYLYSIWGGHVKVQQMQEEFPELLSIKSAMDLDTSFLTTTISASGSGSSSTSNLDLQSIMKASTAISGEVVLEHLVEKLLKIILENAGAQRCCLVRPNEKGDWLIQGEGTIDGQLTVMQRTPVKGSDKISEAVLQYVGRTQESVVLNDAVNHHQFGNTPYITRHQPKSVLCTPIINQGNLLGMLYLENNLTTGAFPRYRIEMLKLLSGQIAVSIDNALLYENLEFKVRERTATIEQQNKEIALEKLKTDELLLNILPKTTADELKKNGHAVPKSYDMVSVLFSDFKGFTLISEQLSPAEVISELNECFTAFDEIIERHNLEKIKTIGDAYMCAGGLPIANETNPLDAVLAGLEMQSFMHKWNDRRKAEGQRLWELRLGIHTGRVVAGVVGTKKFAYDIWGDAVNIAARMEATGEVGRVNISHATYDLIKSDPRLAFSPRGKVKAKNKGEVEMYYVELVGKSAD
jgi:histidine kinase